MKRKKGNTHRSILFPFYFLLFTSLLLPIFDRIGFCTSPVTVTSDERGVVRLSADSGIASGAAHIEKIAGADSIAGLSGPKDQVEWSGAVDRPGIYSLIITYACASDSPGSKFQIEISGRTFAATTASTGSESDFTSVTVGSVEIEREFQLTLRGLDTDGSALMNARSVILEPATTAQVERRLGAATQPVATTEPLAVSQPATPDEKPLIANIDVSEVPQLEDWALEARQRGIKWYPIISAALKTDGFAPPRKFDLIFRKEMPGVAGTSGDRIAISAAWVTAHPDDFGMVGHELTHVIQHYPSNNAGWLVEGIADYVRYYVLEPGSRQAHFNAATSSYRQGYQPAAGLLHYLESSRAPGVVAKVNTALRKGKFREEMFRELAGDDLDELWKAYKLSLGTPAHPTTR